MTQHHGSAADFAAFKGMRPFDEFEITSGAGAGNTYRYYGQYGWGQTSSGGTPLVSPMKLAMEQNIGTGNEFGRFIEKCIMTPVAASLTDYNVSGGVPGILIGVLMGTGQSGEVTLKNGTTTLLAVTPGANLSASFRGGNCDTDIRITTAALGACLVFWNAQ